MTLTQGRLKMAALRDVKESDSWAKELNYSSFIVMILRAHSHATNLAHVRGNPLRTGLSTYRVTDETCFFCSFRAKGSQVKFQNISSETREKMQSNPAAKDAS